MDQLHGATLPQGGFVNVGVLSPTTWQLVEKLASLFPEGVEVVGPLADSGHYWNDYRRKIGEWEDLGLPVRLHLTPYEAVDFSAYDVLVESVETFAYAESWRVHCERLECPILLKACWTRSPVEVVPLAYVEKTRAFPVLLEMPAHAPAWREAGYRDVNVLPNPVGWWWFHRAWTGEQERALFVLSGAGEWRGSEPSWFGWEIWDELSRAFPGRTYHHDGHVSYLTSREMTDLFGSSRVFVNLDRPYGQGERPLTLAFTEALSAGLPVVARDLPGLSYKTLIDGNGVCTNAVPEMCDFIERCLDDREFARACGERSREIAVTTFSQHALRPRYDELIGRARTTFEEAVGANTAGQTLGAVRGEPGTVPRDER
jgi:glycosyltransferase involved in cell wall biosynthesis